MFKVALVNIWFSNKFPSYFDFFCKSCEINSENFNWFVFTDLVKANTKINECVSLIPYSWDKLVLEFKLKEKLNYLRSSSAWQTVCSWPKNGFPYRMLLFKKRDFWKEYDFVGTSDLDIIFGNLSNFIKEDEIREVGMITAHSGIKTPTGRVRNCCPFSFYNKKDIDIIWDYREKSEDARDDNYNFSDFFSKYSTIYSPKNLQPIGDSLFMGRGMIDYKCWWHDNKIFVNKVEGGMFHLLPYKEFKNFKVNQKLISKKSWMITKNGINSSKFFN